MNIHGITEAFFFDGAASELMYVPIVAVPSAGDAVTVAAGIFMFFFGGG